MKTPVKVALITALAGIITVYVTRHYQKLDADRIYQAEQQKFSLEQLRERFSAYDTLIDLTTDEKIAEANFERVARAMGTVTAKGSTNAAKIANEWRLLITNYRGRTIDKAYSDEFEDLRTRFRNIAQKEHDVFMRTKQ